ncbi:dihydrodipicolinate synthase family protein [Paraflavitalea sp. CAU 1676]|uniref:dihydrodipicolinate synthase family protein n=1 Tax=Paraflavitalea sp. CAU 1676 TaxID=3032598 RepID=UPI0023DCBBFF|nr:dihydrodipicolinate synthase family protein [Paraflavitalea sp. CAU 1676]MDF2191694.1 dihydrodipicolinate synthase family protein [Paraflavitalea sp. CAU 1676]
MMKIEGLIAATFGAFHEDGTLNLSPIPDLVEKLIKDGVAGVFICGTNGEGPNLTIEERMAVAEAYVKAVNKRVLVLVHVGHPSIAESRKLAAHAASIGADAISAVAAFYFKPGSVQNLVNCMVEIASAAPSLPFYYYHVPALTGVGMDMIDFLRLAEDVIPNLAGIKYTAATIFEYQACLNYKNGKFNILYGYDEMLLSALAVGAGGAIGSTYTFAAPLYLKVVSLFRAGKQQEAQALQLKLVEMVRCLLKFSPIPAQKAIMEMLGYSLGPSRLPLVSLTAQEAASLKASLNEVGFFELLEKYNASPKAVTVG